MSAPSNSGSCPWAREEERLPVASTSPERLLREEEPEALSDQPVLERADDDDDEDELEEPLAEAEEVFEAGPVSHEDADLVRMYLSQLGKRPLLTFAQEQEIGLRIEQRRADLLTALAALPCALSDDRQPRRARSEGPRTSRRAHPHAGWGRADP